MTAVVEAAVGEIARVAAWSLRGLGMAFGVAHRAAPLVAWAEAVEGGALRTIREITDHLGNSPPADWHRQLSPRAWVLDAAGRSLLEVGPVAIDLLTLAARSGQVGRVDIANAADPVFLSGTARLGARRQVAIVALSSGPCLTLCGTPVAAIYVGPGSQGTVFDDAWGPQGGAIDRALAEWRSDPAPVGRSSISLLSYLPAAKDRAPSRFDAEHRFARAQARGIPVDRADLAHLYQLEIRTWAPTSERSRKQALF